MKLIIDIPNEVYDILTEYQVLPDNIDLEYFVIHGIPLEEIKAEIIEEKDCAYADFERYKVDYLGQDWEDAYDSLPQDDYRYGMERALEIIDKHIKENKQ